MSNLTPEQARALGIDHAPALSPGLQAAIDDANNRMAAGITAAPSAPPTTRWASSREEPRARAARAGRTAQARGERDEALVAQACDRYAAEGRAHVVKRPTPFVQQGPSAPDGTFRGRRTEAAGVDYAGAVAGGRAVAFDAKGSGAAGLPLEQHGKPTLKPAQVAELDAVHALGGIAGVLVRTAPRRNRRPVPTWWWLSWPAWRAAVAAAEAQGRASITAHLLNTHATPVQLVHGAPDWLPAALAGAEDNAHD